MNVDATTNMEEYYQPT